MARGGFPGMPGGNMQQMLKQFNRGRLPGMRGGFHRKRR